ncbi:MAG: CrcB family protein [Atopobiaceae bacterium]|nr:CrcB family protein [Atopobiaceae bacterium]
MFANCLAVGVGGFVGSVLRYIIGNAIPHDTFPWATLAINVAGSFALAAIVGLVLRGTMDDGSLSLMLRVGLCGGFTTMSTFSLEVVGLASRGAWFGALGYAVLTCVLCVGASYAGGCRVCCAQRKR